MNKNCENCIHSYYDDLFYELCCDRDRKYIGELHAKERAKNCEHYEREKRKIKPLLNQLSNGAWGKN